MSFILPITTPKQQLPDPAQRISSKFVQANGNPAGLWLPSKLAKAAADFTPLPKKNFGTLNGGVTPTAGEFGTLGQSWHTNGSNGYVLSAISGTSGSSFSVSVTFRLNSIPVSTGVFQWANQLTSLNPFILIQQNSGNLKIFVDGGYRETSQTLAVGTWYTVAVTLSGGTAWKFYLDGALLSTYVGGVANQANATGAYLGNGYNGYADANFANLTIWKGSALTASQVSSLYNALLTGEPYPLFAPTANERMWGNVVASGPASASGAGGLIASGSLIASSLIAAVGGIVSTFNLVASSLYDAAAGIQAAAAEAVASNLTSGAAGLSSAAVEQVLSNLAGASAGMNVVAAQQVLTNLIAASGGIAGSQSLIASSIISVLAKIQAIAEQSTAIAAQGLAGIAATGDVQVLNNLIALNEQLSAAASFVASSIYSAAARVDGPGSIAVLVNLLSVAERVQALAEQLANSVSAMQAGSGASATVIASSLYCASAGCGAFATVSAILDAAICELASIRPSYTAEAILRAMFKSAAGVRPSYAARADIDGC